MRRELASQWLLMCREFGSAPGTEPAAAEEHVEDLVGVELVLRIHARAAAAAPPQLLPWVLMPASEKALFRAFPSCIRGTSMSAWQEGGNIASRQQ